MVRGGWKQVSNDPDNPDYRFVYTNNALQTILQAKSIRGIAKSWNLRYFGHICRDANTALTKKMMFADSQKPSYKDPWDGRVRQVPTPTKDSKPTEIPGILRKAARAPPCAMKFDNGESTSTSK